MLDEYFQKKRRQQAIFFLGLLLLTVGSILITQYDVIKGFNSGLKAIVWALSNFYPTPETLSRLPAILVKLKETILLSIAATTISAVLAVFFALLGSQTTKVNNILSTFSRGMASVFRNIPLVAWAMVLLLTFGQSSLTGFLAIFFVSFGFLTRVFTETIDEASKSSVEALTASGASYFQIVFQAVMPSSIPQMLSWMLYMVETNIRDATLVGILTGTGIGFSFNMFYRSMNYHAASLVVILIVLTVIGIEYVSNYIRRVIL